MQNANAFGTVPIGGICAWLKTYGQVDTGTNTSTTAFALCDSGANFVVDGVKDNMLVKNENTDACGTMQSGTNRPTGWSYVDPSGTLCATQIPLKEDIFPVAGGTGKTYLIYSTPYLPQGFVECNGQTLSDTESILNGLVVPDLNACAGTERFLRGKTVSGATGGTETHSHTVASHSHAVDAHSHTMCSHSHTVASHSHTVASHSHTVAAHSHTVDSHSHTVAAHSHAVCAHSHTINSHAHGMNSHTHPFTPNGESVTEGECSSKTVGADTAATTGAATGSTTAVALSTNETSGDTQSETPGTSSATPGTSSSSPGTSSETPGTSSATPGTSSATPDMSSETPGTSAASPATNAIGTLPSYYEVVWVMRMK